MNLNTTHCNFNEYALINMYEDILNYNYFQIFRFEFYSFLTEIVGILERMTLIR